MLSPHDTSYSLDGFSSYFQSMDVTHIYVECCCHGIKNLHDGAKSSSLCRTYRIVPNNHRKKLDSDSGHTGRQNNKILAFYHDVIVKIRGGHIFQDIIF